MVDSRPIFDAIRDGMYLDSDSSRRVGSELIRNLAVLVTEGRMGPDFEDPFSEICCELLTLGGCAEQHGDKMNPIYYVPTQRGREIYKRVLN